MTFPAAPEHQKGMVRGLIIAIVIMTIAIVLLFGAIVGRLLSPSVEEDEAAGVEPASTQAPVAAGAIDFSGAEEVPVRLPEGARLIEAQISPDRATYLIETAEGRTEVLTAPLTGYDRAVRLVVEER
ncbi:MAG: hypothetical protein PVI23_15800 [Maricaulaceae bacterium]|jgi:hypothetical protein